VFQPLRYAWAWLLSGLGLMSLVLYLALIPDNRVVAVDFLSDKTAHGLTFLVLMIWFCGIFRLRSTPAIALFLLLYGVLIEYLQSRLPYRSAEAGDLLFDLGGVLLGWLLALAGLRHWAAYIEQRLSKDRG